MAVCALHNFIMSRQNARAMYTANGMSDREGEGGSLIEGAWRQESTLRETMIPLQATRGDYPTDAKIIREELENYFVTDGEVPWQYGFI